MGRRASRSACQTCRDRHLKCDSIGTPCYNCTKSGRECKASSWYLFQSQPSNLGQRHHRRQSRRFSISTLLSQQNESDVHEERHQLSHPNSSRPNSHGGEVLFVNHFEQPDQLQFGRSTTTRSGTNLTPAEVTRDLRVNLPSSSAAPPPCSEHNSVSGVSPQTSSLHARDATASGSTGPPTSWPVSHQTPIDNNKYQDGADDHIGIDANETASISPGQIGSQRYDEQQPRADWTAEDIFATRAQPSPIGSEDLAESGVPSTGCRSESEAHLLRYFIQVWGPLLDATDESRQFSTSIPHLAWTESPCLLYAILALAACQLSRLSDSHSIQTASFYRKKCAQVLVPILLEDPNSVHEASIFATYVLLRVYDHMTVTLSERQPESLFSEGLALSTKPWNAYSHKACLKRAAFWIHLRQDVHVALMLQCPVRVEHTLYEQTVASAIDVTESDYRARMALRSQSESQQQKHPTNTVEGGEDSCGGRIDCAWANRLVGLACRIINYCFDSRTQSVEEWASLLVELQSWNLRKPKTFRPFFEQPPDVASSRPFPTIVLQNDYHVIGMLYYHMSVALLKSHQPGNCCRNGSLGEVGYDTREEILHQARLLCGVATSNPISQCLLIIGAMLNIIGRFFVDQPSQQGAVELLELATSTTGTPADFIAARLAASWNS